MTLSFYQSTNFRTKPVIFSGNYKLIILTLKRQKIKWALVTRNITKPFLHCGSLLTHHPTKYLNLGTRPSISSNGSKLITLSQVLYWCLFFQPLKGKVDFSEIWYENVKVKKMPLSILQIVLKILAPFHLIPNHW